ncbi:CoA transferase [Paremcibacter congregatus]|uniref:Pterin-binding domain-containing protein n=1 Tax=Paremcibacter congregatus TaxID=2043170 RepID=A0A2G4YNK3_9PROT|nr:CoA transferase [Paremcibacter congregatus]PHZ83873.1 hypothetical protein CRD36_16115 [Paremcibacter congregatus]QDE27578.1 hypothetical protein FIV45_09950 [Paremcibacter congregatus]
MAIVTSHKSPLDGVRIIDLGGHLAGPLAAMLLTDQGAETLRIISPKNSNVDHPINAILNRGKFEIPLDLRIDTDRMILDSFMQEADIFIENYAPGAMSRLGLDISYLKERFPKLIIISLPGFTSDEEDKKDLKAYEGIIAAMTGQYTDIHAVRNLFGLDPVYTSLPIASVYASIHAATAAVLALNNRAARQGAGLHIEVPLASAALTAMSSIYMDIEQAPARYDAPRLPFFLKKIILPLNRKFVARGGDNRQQKFLNIARKSYPALMTSYTCMDGEVLYLFAIDNSKIVKALFTELKITDELKNAGLVFSNPYQKDLSNNLSETSNLSKKWQKNIKALVTKELSKKTAQKWEERLNKIGIPCVRQRTTQEWINSPELKKAGLAIEINDIELGKIIQPGLQVWLTNFSNTYKQPISRSKKYQKLNWNPKKYHGAYHYRPSVDQSDHTKINASNWLKGVTVIDLCSMVAGPVAGRTMAEYGARVIKVETPMPNHGPRMTCWYGIDGNQGKESILLDLKTSEGQDALKKVLRTADILLTNHLPDAMSRMGLSEAEIYKINPKILYARVNAYNGPQKGPWDTRVGYDPVLQAASGIMKRYGDPNQPELHAIASCVDALTGYSAAFGMALGLYCKSKGENLFSIGTSLAASASLIQLPFAFFPSERKRPEASGQLSKGENAFYRLYQAIDGWVFLAAPNATLFQILSLLQKTHKHQNTISDNEAAKIISNTLKKMKRQKILAMFKKAGLSAAPVDKIQDMKNILLTAPQTDSLQLIERIIPGLGKVQSIPALQTRVEGQMLGILPPAEKPGSSTTRILNEYGMDADELIKRNIAANEICNEYLPGKV